MARTEKAPKKAKEPNRIKQMWDVFTMTRRYDKSVVWFMLLGLIAPIAVGLIVAFVFSSGPGQTVNFVLSIVAGFIFGVLLDLIILGRRAERAAFSQIEGQPGAVGAALKTSVRRGWQASEMPIAVSPRDRDAVYRAIGRGGVALIGEGPRSRTQRMLEDERRTINRVLPNVPVTFLYVGPDPDSTPLYKLSGAMRRIKPALQKREVLAVGNRLDSLKRPPVGIPKGMDPARARAPRPR